MNTVPDNKEKSARQLTVCIAVLLAATVVINLLSAYIRHWEAGAGCSDWPACYGVIGDTIAPRSGMEAAARALTPAPVVKRAHRIIATLLVVLVLAVVYLSRHQRLAGLSRYLPQALIASVLLLAVVGPASYHKSLPMVATVNLVGGMALLSVTYLLHLAVKAPPPLLRSPPNWLRWVLAMLVLQIILGAWVSANFAGAACTRWYGCAPDSLDVGAFRIWRELSVDGNGRIVMDESHVLIALVHRLGAILAVLAISAVGLLLWRDGGASRRWALALLLLLGLQILLGLLGAASGLPLVVVLAHNFLAGIILLILLRVTLTTGGRAA